MSSLIFRQSSTPLLHLTLRRSLAESDGIYRCLSSKSTDSSTKTSFDASFVKPSDGIKQKHYLDKFNKGKKYSGMNLLPQHEKQRQKFFFSGGSDQDAQSYANMAFAGGPFDQSSVFHPNTPNEAKSVGYSNFSAVLLGTGSGNPSLWRGCSSLAVRMGGRTILVDCGEGTQIQMMKSKGLVQFKDIDTILITHLHADHILGLPGMLFGLDTTEMQMKEADTQAMLASLKHKAKAKGVDERHVGIQRPGEPLGEFDVPREVVDRMKDVQIIGPPGLDNFVRSAACMSMASLRNIRVTVKELWGGKYEAGHGNPENPMNPFINSTSHFKHKKIVTERIYKSEDGDWPIENTVRSSKEELEKKLSETEDQKGRMKLTADACPHPNGRNRAFSIRAGEIWHVDKVQTFGYSLKEQPPLPRINPERAQALGLDPGYSYNLLKLGFECKNSEGEIVTIEDVMLEEEHPEGRHLAVLGDCKAVTNAMGSLIEGCNVLVHEATLGDGKEKIASRRGHSTPSMAAKLAVKAGVKDHLILTHFSHTFTGLWGERSVLHPKHHGKGQNIIKKYNHSKGENLKIIHGCDLMEVMIRCKHGPTRRWEDGVGNEYAELAEEKDKMKLQEERDHILKVMEEVGWEWNGGRELTKKATLEQMRKGAKGGGVKGGKEKGNQGSTK